MIYPIFFLRVEYALIGLPFAVIESFRSLFLEAIIIMTVAILLPNLKTIKWKLGSIPLPFLYKGGIEYLRMFRLYGWFYMSLILASFMGTLNDNIRVGKASMIIWGVIQAAAFTSIPHPYERTFFLNYSTFQKYLVRSNAWNAIVTYIPLTGCILFFSLKWETLLFSICVMIGSILYLWNMGMMRYMSSSIVGIALYQLVLLIPLFIYACFIPYLLILFVLINGWLYVLVKNKLEKVLEDLSVTYESGVIYGLVGENGAGKTTLFNCIMGISTYKGEIQKVPDISIGYLPAENHFYTLITGMEYIEFCIKAKGRNFEKKEIEEINRVFQLPLQRYASEYSTGMKKKLVLMALLLQNNDLYILDEPFNGVDLYGCIHLKKIIHSLKNSGKAIIVSSHQITILHELCDCIDYLNHHTIIKRYVSESVEEIEENILADIHQSI